MVPKEPIEIEGRGHSARTVTFILFAQAARVVSKYVDTYLHKHRKLSKIKFIVLNSIDHNGGVMKPSEIAHWTITERHNITTLIQRMKKEGLVRIEPDKNSQRSINVIITDKGKQALNDTIRVAQGVIDQVMLSMTDDDLSQLHQLITVMRKNAYDGLSSIT